MSSHKLRPRTPPPAGGRSSGRPRGWETVPLALSCSAYAKSGDRGEPIDPEMGTNHDCRRGDQMTRRELILILGGAITATHTLQAQQNAMRVVGLLSVRSSGEAAEAVAAFRQGLTETGWVEGQNVSIAYRWAEGHYDRLPALATDLVSRKVDAIAAIAAPSTVTAKKAISTIPIVFLTGTDPVADGLVTSLSPDPAGTSLVSASSLWR
jgi:hypothetical protein